jgi:hypothetical protein
MLAKGIGNRASGFIPLRDEGVESKVDVNG